MKKPACPDCGNNPTNHTLAYIHNTLSIYVEPIDEIFFRSTFGRICIKLFDWATIPYLYLFQLIRFIRWNTDVTRVATDRSRVIWEEANRRGIPMRQLVIMGKPVDLYQATINGHRYMFESIPRPPRLANAGDTWLDDKYTLKRRLQKAGIPVPRGESVTSMTEALRVFEIVTKPVITKPRLGSRGRHTTTYITTPEELHRGFTSAQQLCHHVIVEEHLTGAVYRATCVGGTLVGFLAGVPPRVTGDSIHTVAELITEKNKTKNPKMKDVILNDALIHFIGKQGYTLESIVPIGIPIDLSEKIGISYGGSSEELLPKAHPELRTCIEKAARIVGSPVIGFDVIIADPSIDPSTQHWGIIECNSLPFINLHHEPLIGTPVNIAGYVWDLWKHN